MAPDAGWLLDQVVSSSLVQIPRSRLGYLLVRHQRSLVSEKATTGSFAGRPSPVCMAADFRAEALPPSYMRLATVPFRKGCQNVRTRRGPMYSVFNPLVLAS